MAEYTSFEVKYEFEDLGLDTGTFTINDNSSIASGSLIDGTDFQKVITGEHNFSILDGSCAELTSSNECAYFNTTRSTSAGTYTTSPYIDISFLDFHKSYGLTLYFSETAPTKIKVTWYHNSIVLLAKEIELDPAELIAYVRQVMESFNRVKIEFLEGVPDRYIKLNKVEFGSSIVWDETIIKTGTIVKGLNRISDMLSIDTLTFTLVDDTNSMNYANPNNLQSIFQRDQAMYPVEILDGVRVPLGKFFLDTFSYEANVGTISAYSYMGLLDKIPYNNGTIYNNVYASTVLQDIFAVAGITDYTISSAIGNMRLYGTIAPKSCREALSDVLFACQGIIDTSDPSNVRVAKASGIINSPILRSNKIKTKVVENDPVSGVAVTYTTYTLESEATEIFKDTYSAGTHEVILKSPYSNYSISGATLVSSTTYTVKFTCVSDAEVTLTGKPYEETTRTYTVNSSLSRGQTVNVVEHSTKLCNVDTVKTLANSLLDYYKNNLSIEVQHYASDASLDGSHTIENPVTSLPDFLGVYEERTIDLTGGFLDSAKMVGYFDTSDNFYYTGTELYCNEDVGLI